MDSELIDAVDKHGFVFWVCPNGCNGIVRWNESKTEAVCMECGAKSDKRHHMTDKERLKRIAEIIEAVDNRCMAVDGPVTPTLQEMRQEEISEIYALASRVRCEK